MFVLSLTHRGRALARKSLYLARFGLFVLITAIYIYFWWCVCLIIFEVIGQTIVDAVGSGMYTSI